jgi:hypothetical protein
VTKNKHSQYLSHQSSLVSPALILSLSGSLSSARHVLLHVNSTCLQQEDLHLFLFSYGASHPRLLSCTEYFVCLPGSASTVAAFRGPFFSFSLQAKRFDVSIFNLISLDCPSQTFFFFNFCLLPVSLSLLFLTPCLPSQYHLRVRFAGTLFYPNHGCLILLGCFNFLMAFS